MHFVKSAFTLFTTNFTSKENQTFCVMKTILHVIQIIMLQLSSIMETLKVSHIRIILLFCNLIVITFTIYVQIFGCKHLHSLA